MDGKQELSLEEVARNCQETVDHFLAKIGWRKKEPQTYEEGQAVKAKLAGIRLADPETQTVLEPLLKIVIQIDVSESKDQRTVQWIKGMFMQAAEQIFSYRRVKGGVRGGVRGVLEALGWGKTQAYRAKDLVETFGDWLLTMPVEISVNKLLELIERRTQDKKKGRFFDPVAWLEENKDALREARSSDAIKKLVGTEKEKRPPKPKAVETEVAPDPSFEEFVVANISAKIKHFDQTNLNDVMLKNLSDAQLHGLKRWLDAQGVFDDDSDGVRTQDVSPSVTENIPKSGDIPVAPSSSDETEKSVATGRAKAEIKTEVVENSVCDPENDMDPILKQSLKSGSEVYSKFIRHNPRNYERAEKQAYNEATNFYINKNGLDRNKIKPGKLINDWRKMGWWPPRLTYEKDRCKFFKTLGTRVDTGQKWDLPDNEHLRNPSAVKKGK